MKIVANAVTLYAVILFTLSFHSDSAGVLQVMIARSTLPLIEHKIR